MKQQIGIVRPIDEQGRVELPKEVLKRMALKAGDQLDIMALDSEIILQPYGIYAGARESVERLVDDLQGDTSIPYTVKEEIFNLLMPLRMRLEELEESE